jgi:hypothetical protein
MFDDDINFTFLLGYLLHGSQTKLSSVFLYLRNDKKTTVVMPQEKLDDFRKELLVDENSRLQIPDQQAGRLAGDQDPSVSCHRRLGHNCAQRRLANFTQYFSCL